MFVAGAGFGGGRKGNSLWIWVRSLLLETGDATTQGSKVVLLLNPLFYFVYLSPLTAGLISPRCVAGVGDKKIFSILAKKY